MHFTDTQKRYTLPLFITACSHTTKMQKALILIEIILWGCNFGSEEVHFDFKGGATTALGGATIAY